MSNSNNCNNCTNPKCNNEQEVSIQESDIVGFRVMRNFFNNTTFNVYAVDKKGAILVAFATDLDLETAQDTAATLNAPYCIPEPTVTELTEVQVQQDTRFYNTAVA